MDGGGAGDFPERGNLVDGGEPPVGGTAPLQADNAMGFERNIGGLSDAARAIVLGGGIIAGADLTVWGAIGGGGAVAAGFDIGTFGLLRLFPRAVPWLFGAAGGATCTLTECNAPGSVGSGSSQAAVSLESRFASTDPHVTDVAVAIEREYPGHVVGVNRIVFGEGGRLVTEFDIILRNAVPQVKSGAGRGLTTQMRISESVTHLPVIGYGPNLGGTLVNDILGSGGLVFQDPGELVSFVRP